MSAAERFLAFDADAVTVARRLLGQRLVRVIDGTRLAGTIVEVEAYLGPADRAAHCYGGRRTQRNESMYRGGGHAYVYFTYGRHYCMNIVCAGEDDPQAVLVRALEPTEGTEEMRRRRTRARDVRDLCSGPAKLAQALGIDRSQDGVDLRTSAVLLLERLRHRAPSRDRILLTPRIGVDYAGEWAARPLRFCLRGNPHVSRPRVPNRAAAERRILNGPGPPGRYHSPGSIELILT